MDYQDIFMKHTVKILACAVISLIFTMIICRDAFSRFVVIRILIAVIMAIGLNVTTGLTGQLSMGQAAFMGISAYSSAMCTINLGGSLGIIAGLILSLILCGLSAFIIGFCVLRLSGDYLALATLGFGEIVRVIFENSENFGSAAGLYNIPKYSSVAGATLACTVCLVIFVRYKYSSIGLLSNAVKDNEDAAAACGINNSRIKIQGFVAGAMICSVAGWLYGGLIGFISPMDFSFSRSIDTLASVVLGGAGNVFGPMLAACLIEGQNVFLQGLAKYRMLVYGIILILFSTKILNRDKKQVYHK